ncbi:uncharacterized protein LOC108033003 [Drosophila biarmipes]|uniref:uncharacterized protein LOC108033003 n=1 Tax=Drosophila biarmipes TaxID=125945 RepID=UPI0007E66BAF|nr:uncharacterized protein LOC108033003 [Drosophila biarmipes]
MKPDQLNRLIRVNTRMQPWFLRNTSALYESAVRTYYERGYSSHNRHPRLRTENVGPLRRLKRSEPVPSPADSYPRTHVRQADKVVHSNSGQLLYTMMQASRPRSMSFSAARAYPPAYGQGSVRRAGSSSCSSGSSSGSSRTELMVGSLRKSKARRERKRSMHKSRESREEPQLGDMGGMFSARSMSLPPLPTAPGLRSGAMMPPSRQHHMAVMAKSALATPMGIPRGEADSLMPVDAALKRRISVLTQLEDSRARTELGQQLSAGAPGTGNGNGNGSHVTGSGRQPSETRLRFQTLGDRIKQFEYIQFADGPVATYAFNRSQRRPMERSTPRSRLEDSTDTTTRRLEVRQQPRQLGFHNVLHANFRQRSQSLESGAVQLMESLAPVSRPETPLGPRGLGGNTRGSSLDSSSRTSFKPSTLNATWAQILERNAETFADDLVNRSEDNFGYSRSSEETLGDWDAAAGEDPCKYPRSRRSNLTIAEQNVVGNANAKAKGTVNKLRSIEKLKGLETSGPTTYNSEHSKASSGPFPQTLPGPDESSRATVAPVRRLQLQQRGLQTASKEDDQMSEDLPLSHFPARVKDKVNDQVKDKPKKKKSLVRLQKNLEDKPRVTKVINNQVSRSSHRSFFQPPEEADLPAGHPPKQSHHEKKPEKKQEKNQKQEDRTSVPQSKGANQLLVASASQVSAYKRAFRTQQQMLKAEILHQQAQHLQPSQRNTPTEEPKQAPKLQSHRGSMPNTNRSTNRAVARRRAANSGGKAPTLDEGVSKAGAGTRALPTAKPEAKGSELKPKGFKGLSVKAAATPATEHLTAKRTAQMSAAKKGTATKTTKKGVATAGGEGRGDGGGAAGRRAGAEGTGTTKTRRSALTLAAQQQHSRSGNSLLGFRRETVNRAAAALLPRRDADEPLSQLQLQSQSQSASAQQRRQFHFPYPPWRPSY